MRYLFSFLACLLCAGLSAETKAVGHQALSYIGFYHDGSGVFPGATPVTTWNEYNVTSVPKSEQKNKNDRYRLGEKNHVNIVWKVPHYNWCNGGMIIVGGNLYALSDRGGYGFYAERAADFTGTELFCIDPATGKELWKRDLNPWDLIADGDAFRAKILTYNKKQAEVLSLYSPLGYAMRARASGTHLTPAEYLKLAAPLRKHIKDMPATLADIKGHIIDSKGYEHMHFWKSIQPKYWPEITTLRKEITSAGYLQDPWASKPDHLGMNMQTPVSDGKYIYISTAYGAIYCVDLNGTMVWQRYLGGAFIRGQAIPSPVLIDDVLVLVGARDDAQAKNGRLPSCWMAVNKTDGKTIWTAPFKGGYQSSPIALTLPITGDSNKCVKVLHFQGAGRVLRVSDGKELATGLGGSWTGRPWAVDGDIVIFNNKNAAGGAGKNVNDFKRGIGAVRLKAVSPEQVIGELLWDGKDLPQESLVARGGILFSLGSGIESYNLITGEQIAKQGRRAVRSNHFTILAGDYVISLGVGGTSSVAKVSADGKTLGPITHNRLGAHLYGRGQGPYYERFSYGCQPFASGNRLFIRSMTDLYCIGDPQQQMILSPEHR